MSKPRSVVECGSRFDPNRPSRDWLTTIQLTANAYIGMNPKRPGAKLLAKAREYARICEQVIEEGNAKSAAYYALAALQAVWLAEIKEGRSMIDHGVTAARKAEQQRAKMSAEATARRAAWQKEAEIIWGRHKEWTAFQVARKIDSLKANTIRRHIRKPPAN